MPTTSSPPSSRRSLGREGLALALWGALAGLFVLAAFSSRGQESMPDDVLYDPDLAISGVIFYGIMVAIAVGIAHLYPRPWHDLGFRRFRARWVWIAFGVVLLTLIVGRILEPYLHGGEEIFFRGLGVRALKLLGVVAAVLVTGIVFGLVHGILGALPPLALFGIGLAWVRAASGSVWPGVIAHMTYNGVGIGLLVLSWALDVPVK